MEKQIKDILLKFDEQGRYETPSNFNYSQLKSRVTDLVKELENVFKLKFEIDDKIQDASFYCDVVIPHELVTSPSPTLGYAIRISNFGGLATMTFVEDYPENIRAIIKATLAKNSFNFIHSDDLEDEYDGSFEKFKEILGGSKPSWWIRYFDYL